MVTKSIKFFTTNFLFLKVSVSRNDVRKANEKEEEEKSKENSISPTVTLHLSPTTTSYVFLFPPPKSQHRTHFPLKRQSMTASYKTRRRAKETNGQPKRENQKMLLIDFLNVIFSFFLPCHPWHDISRAFTHTHALERWVDGGKKVVFLSCCSGKTIYTKNLCGTPPRRQ